ncbi:class I SAM-dependent methyltransferase [Clostridium polynesiense]|uniref:class I SAM-dependent methyltransferase n=1 Tax=Clostridium polynesiense TaxID=1325933 RepID=UPI00069412F5|nr:class I SAM-dependent methyltransferase [Clostridium polynesiense]
MKILKEQFANPQGNLGKLSGLLMQIKDKNQSSWVVANSKVKPKSSVLEVGFGPGLGIESASGFAFEGFVAGIDISDIMLQTATKRNSEKIRQGKVELLKGDVMEIPFEDYYFDLVFSVNSIQYWEDVQESLREIKRVLKDNGEIAIAMHPYWLETEADCIQLREKITKEVQAAGFKNVKANLLYLKPVTAFCIYGLK